MFPKRVLLVLKGVNKGVLEWNEDCLWRPDFWDELFVFATTSYQIGTLCCSQQGGGIVSGQEETTKTKNGELGEKKKRLERCLENAKES